MSKLDDLRRMREQRAEQIKNPDRSRIESVALQDSTLSPTDGSRAPNRADNGITQLDATDEEIIKALAFWLKHRQRSAEAMRRHRAKKGK